jgi:hypothetical protein
MCDLCDESETGEMQSCQDCGRLICFDVENGDDVCAPAYVTCSGDLYCDRYGTAHDIAADDSSQEHGEEGEDYGLAEYGLEEFYGAGVSDDDAAPCWRCGGLGGWHDCGEDTCACLDKSPNMACPVCGDEDDGETLEI